MSTLIGAIKPSLSTVWTKSGRAEDNILIVPSTRYVKNYDQLGQQRFRLSCREADWYGAFDREELKKVSPDGEIRGVILC